MPISHFREILVSRLKIDPIPENIVNETGFERNFVAPIAFDICKTETDVFLFSHPWGRKVRCTPDCHSAREGKGHIKEGCDICWKESKYWGTLDAFGTQNNFDLVGKDTKGAIIAVEIKLVKAKEGRMPNGEIQRFLGQCAFAASKFDFVIGICGYHGTLNPKYNPDTERFTQWAEDHNIALIFRSVSIERYMNYEIELVNIRSFRDHRYGKEFFYNDRHGVELTYKGDNRKILVGFIECYMWFHEKR